MFNLEGKSVSKPLVEDTVLDVAGRGDLVSDEVVIALVFGRQGEVVHELHPEEPQTGNRSI